MHNPAKRAWRNRFSGVHSKNSILAVMNGSNQRRHIHFRGRETLAPAACATVREIGEWAWRYLQLLEMG
jgi:hypothetical protein